MALILSKMGQPAMKNRVTDSAFTLADLCGCYAEDTLKWDRSRGSKTNLKCYHKKKKMLPQESKLQTVRNNQTDCIILKAEQTRFADWGS